MCATRNRASEVDRRVRVPIRRGAEFTMSGDQANVTGGSNPPAKELPSQPIQNLPSPELICIPQLCVRGETVQKGDPQDRTPREECRAFRRHAA